MCPQGLELVEVTDEFILVSCSLRAIQGEMRSSHYLLENALVLVVW